MRKLLAFYIPQMIPRILSIFCVLLVALFCLSFLPIEKLAIKFFAYLVIALIFPIWAYFNQKSYLSGDLNWLLLTPIKKSEIYFSNAIINAIKITIIITIVLVFFYIVDKENIISFITKFSKISTDWSELNSYHLFYRLFLMLILGAVIVMMNTTKWESAFVAPDVKLYQYFAKDKKQTFYFIMTIAVLMIILRWLMGNNHSLPEFIMLPFFASGLIILIVGSSFHALKIYFSTNSFSVIGLILGILLSFSFYKHSIRNLSSNHTKLSIKIAELDFLDSYAGDYRVEVLNVLIGDDEKNLSNLFYEDLNDYLRAPSNQEQTKKLSKIWDSKCHQRKDYNCRLASYVYTSLGNYELVLDLVKLSCPHDLQSCNLVLNSSKKNSEEYIIAEKFLIEACNVKTDKNKKICDKYHKHLEESKKK